MAGKPKDCDLDELEIKLSLLDIVAPYGVTGKDLSLFGAESLFILQLPPQERKKALFDLADRIKKYYEKTELAKSKTQRE